LIEEGKADFNIANKFNNTCLMIASFNGHLNVVRYVMISPGIIE
jgi:ankyrin repeat protein